MITFFAPASTWALALVAVGEEAGGLQHDVRTEVLPRQVRRVALLERGEALAPHRDGVTGCLHLALEAAEDRVVLEQVGQGRVVRQVVDADDLDVGSARLLQSVDGSEKVPADPAEPVDTYAHSHGS
jgi:hypothetical protein